MGALGISSVARRTLVLRDWAGGCAVECALERRRMDVSSDTDRLLAMHRVSWKINFPGRHLDEWVFASSLEASARRGNVYVYECEGELVAWLWMGYPGRDTAHVRHVQVAQAYWGRGIARRVMYDAMRLGLERGCRYLTLAVTKSNARAMALYDHLGFRPTADEGARQHMRLDLEEHPPPPG